MVVASPNQRRDAVAASPNGCRDSAYTAAIDQGTGIQVLASRDMPPKG